MANSIGVLISKPLDLFKQIEDRPQFIAQLLVLGIVISMTRAFALTSLLEVMLWCFFAFNASLRDRLAEALHDTRVLLVLAFWIWIGISSTWSDAPMQERFLDWWSWRKLSLVPICFALFKSERSKVALGIVIIFTCAVFAFSSWLGYWEIISLDRAPSQLLENHSTQGVLFTGSALLSVLFLKHTNNRLIQILLLILIAVFVSNVIIVVTGRSGYLFLFVCSSYVGFVELRKYGLRWLVIPPLLVIIALTASDTANRRILQAYNEATQVVLSPKSDSVTQEHGTSLGHRVFMWVNTISLIGDRPLLGTGSGGYKIAYGDLVEGLEGWRGRVVDDPHQQYLHIAAEYGLLGLVLFLCAIASWLFTKPDVRTPFHFAATGILLGTLANGFANGHFSTFVEGRFLWIVLAAFLAGTPDYLRDRFHSLMH